MIAALLTEHGKPPRPAPYELARPAPGQSRVTVTAAPIVPLDLLCASGTSYFGAPALPYVPGVQGVGVREDGTRVWFNTDAGMKPGDGSLAEAAVVDDAETVPLPDGVPDSMAAALGLSAVAAWMALTWRGQLRAGERVLVLGAGGAVGQVAVQAAVALGAGAVVAASRREAFRRRALDHGAAATVDLSTLPQPARSAPAAPTGTAPAGTVPPGGTAPAGTVPPGGTAPAGVDTAGVDTAGADTAGVDTARVDTAGADTARVDTAGVDTARVDTAGVDILVSRMQQAAGGPVDLVVDPIGGAASTAALLVLGDRGRLVHLGAAGGPTATFSSAALRSGSHSILGYTNASLTREQRAQALTRVLELAAAGRCDVAYQIVALADVAAAWTRAGAAPDGRQVVVP